MDRRWMSHAILEDLDAIKRSREWGSQDARLKPSVSTLDLPRTPYHERRSTLYASLPFVAVPGLGGRTNDVVRHISYRTYMAEREQYKSIGPPDATLASSQQQPGVGGDEKLPEGSAAGVPGEASAAERRILEAERLRRQIELAPFGEYERRGSAAFCGPYGALPPGTSPAMMGFPGAPGGPPGPMMPYTPSPSRSSFLRACRSCATGDDGYYGDGASAAMLAQQRSLALAPRSKEEEALYVECQIAEDELRRDVVTAPMIMACGVACVSQFLCGYQTSVMNAPEKYVFPGHTTAMWSLAVSAFAIGGPAGAILGGYLANSRGRRAALLFDAFLFLIGGALMTVAPTITWLIIGRFVVGLASGYSSVLVPIYLGELAPPVLRGTFGTCTQFALVIGILASDLLALSVGGDAWRVLFGATPVLALLQLLCAPHLLESPRWLLDRDEASQLARDALRKLYGFRDAEQIEHEVSHIVGANAVHKMSEHETSSMKTDLVSALTSIYQDDNVRPLLFAAVALHVAQQLCGINAVFYYSTMFFDGVIDDPLLGTTIVAAVNVAATYVAIILMDHAGRATLLAWSSAGMLSCVAFMTLALYGLLNKLVALAAVASYVACFEIGLGPIPWLIVAEMFDSRHVDTAQSIASQVNWICNFLIGFGFPSLNALLGAATFVPFGAVLAVTLVFVLVLLPETRGATVSDIQEHMQHNIGKVLKASGSKSASGAAPKKGLFGKKGPSSDGGAEATTKYAPILAPREVADLT